MGTRELQNTVTWAKVTTKYSLMGSCEIQNTDPWANAPIK